MIKLRDGAAAPSSKVNDGRKIVSAIQRKPQTVTLKHVRIYHHIIFFFGEWAIGCHEARICFVLHSLQTIHERKIAINSFVFFIHSRVVFPVPCFYRVIETRVQVWENEKCCGNTSRRRVFPQLLRVLPNFHECF